LFTGVVLREVRGGSVCGSCLPHTGILRIAYFFSVDPRLRRCCVDPRDLDQDHFKMFYRAFCQNCLFDWSGLLRSKPSKPRPTALLAAFR
jgi:hypothetical protein